MKSALSITIDASPALVFSLAHDVTRWADLLPHYTRSRALHDEPGGHALVEFVARRPIASWGWFALPVVWRAETWNDPTRCELYFRHRGGATGGMRVTWRVEPGDAGAGAVVRIEHDFPAPLAWARFIDRFFSRPIATRTLRTFRVLAETLSASEMAPATK